MLVMYWLTTEIVLFEFFDFNENNFLDEQDIQFLVYTCVSASYKIFSIGGIATRADDSNIQQHETNEKMLQLIRETFPEGMKISISDMLKWAVGTTAIKEFFDVIDIMNTKNAANIWVFRICFNI